MGVNSVVTTDQKTNTRKPKALPKTKYSSKKSNEGQVRSKSDRSKLMALQDALQDPNKGCEGF